MNVSPHPICVHNESNLESSESLAFGLFRILSFQNLIESFKSESLQSLTESLDRLALRIFRNLAFLFDHFAVHCGIALSLNDTHNAVFDHNESNLIRQHNFVTSVWEQHLWEYDNCPAMLSR